MTVLFVPQSSHSLSRSRPLVGHITRPWLANSAPAGCKYISVDSISRCFDQKAVSCSKSSSENQCGYQTASIQLKTTQIQKWMHSMTGKSTVLKALQSMLWAHGSVLRWWLVRRCMWTTWSHWKIESHGGGTGSMLKIPELLSYDESTLSCHQLSLWQVCLRSGAHADSRTRVKKLVVHWDCSWLFMVKDALLVRG